MSSEAVRSNDGLYGIEEAKGMRLIMKKSIFAAAVIIAAAAVTSCQEYTAITAEAATKSGYVNEGPGVALKKEETPVIKIESDVKETAAAETSPADTAQSTAAETTAAETTVAETQTETEKGQITKAEVGVDQSWIYADRIAIGSGKAVLYKQNGNGITVCVNAGHGTKGGESVKTICHPDGTPKVTGGTTSAGATKAVAVSSGTTFKDEATEAKVNLEVAVRLRDRLLEKGYNVLMIREEDDKQLDNVARTVLANNLAQCHIAIHFDSTESDKGAFYMSVPNTASYRAMEPVASHWKEHHALGGSLIAGLKETGVKIFSSGDMAMDLTQTSYSTVPSVDIELGDRVTDHSAGSLDKLAAGLALGVDKFFGR